MNNLERAAKYMHIQWHPVMAKFIMKIFSMLDLIMYFFEKKKMFSVAKLLLPLYKKLHDVVLSISLQDMLVQKENASKY